MSDDRELDVLDTLRADVSSVTASPALAARVRTRIADERGITFGLTARQWRWSVGAASCAAASIFVFMAMHDQPVVPIASTARGAAVASVVAVTTNTPAPATRTAAVARRPLTRLIPSAQPRAARAADTTATSPDVTTPAVEAALEIITDQPAIIRAVSARLAARPLVGQTPLITLDIEVPTIVVPPIAVSPVVLNWTDERPTDGPGGTPIIKRTISADMTADRSRR